MTDQPYAAQFVPGYVGEPGNRTFLFQVDDARGRVWYLLEKAQVAAFAEHAGALLTELGLVGVGREVELAEMSEPQAIEFRVGQLAIAVREDELMIEIALTPVDDATDSATHAITAAQLDAAAAAARRAVSQGRPLCPRCSLAMDPEGHVCPTTNGDLRDHRP